MRNEKITYEEQYHGHPIMTDKARSFGCKESILQKIDQLMTDMSNRHSKVFFMRYDVRFPQGYDYPNDNELFSKIRILSASYGKTVAHTVRYQMKRGKSAWTNGTVTLNNALTESMARNQLKAKFPGATIRILSFVIKK